MGLWEEWGVGSESCSLRSEVTEGLGGTNEKWCALHAPHAQVVLVFLGAKVQGAWMTDQSCAVVGGGGEEQMAGYRLRFFSASRPESTHFPSAIASRNF